VKTGFFYYLNPLNLTLGWLCETYLLKKKIIKIPSTKKQIPNKCQHAAQAPALRVTQIQNSKQMNR